MRMLPNKRKTSAFPHASAFSRSLKGVFHMSRYLQMTFVPRMEKGWNFFIWLTDEEGRHLSLLDTDSDTEIPFWLGSHSPYRIFASSAEFIDSTGTYTVHGALMTMESGFRLMKDDILSRADGDILPGITWQWFERIGETVGILIEKGQFYPFFYHVKNGKGIFSYFCEWMPETDKVVASGLFADWLGTLPELSFSIVDLQDERVRQWLCLVLIYWTNALVRDLTADHSDDVLPDQLSGDPRPAETNPISQLLADGFPFNHSEKPWITTGDSAQIRKLNQLEMEMAGWIQPATDKNAGSWTTALIAFKKKQLEKLFTPESVQFSLEPDNLDNPFASDTLWSYDIAVRGRQNDAPAEWSLDKFQSAASLGRSSWMDRRINTLEGSVPETVLSLLNGPGRGYLSAGEVSELYQYHNALRAVSIILLLPESLGISESTDPVTVDLNISTETAGHGSLLSLSALINFNWRISVGNIELNADTFRQLVRDHQSFIRHGAGWVHLPMNQMIQVYKEMDGVNDLFGNKPDVAGTLRLDILTRRKRKRYVNIHMASGLEDYLSGLLKKPSKTVPVSDAFTGKLRPYQKKGYTWLVNLRHRHVGGCLADDMGLGKTVQAIAYLDYCRRSVSTDDPAGPSLIICPTSLVANWKHECRTFSPSLDIYIHHGAARLKGDRLAERLKSCDVMVTSYAIYTKEADRLNRILWQSTILDEAQAIKNPHAQKTRALRHIRSAHRLVLTGTPIENHLEELWSIMDFLNPGYLGPLERFRKQFISPIEKKSSRSRAADLTKIIRPFILRREKTDKRIIHDLPDKTETKKTCFLSKEQASLYQSIVNHLINHVETAGGIQRKGLILSTLTKLKQVCDDPSLVLDDSDEKEASGKLSLFYDLLDPLFGRDEKVLVFTQYVRMGERLLRETRKRYPDADVFFLHGGLSAGQRENLIRRFQQEDRRKTLFILSLKAGGLGINLTEAGYVFHYDRWWNPAVEEQATDRAYRIGQKRNVQVYKLICEGTLEERIDLLIDQKKNLQKQILGRGEAWITEMSDSEIYDLIRLREGVI